MNGYADRKVFATREIDLDAGSLTDIVLTAFGTQQVQIHRLEFTGTTSSAGGATILFEKNGSTTIESVVVPASSVLNKTYYTKLTTPFVLAAGDYVTYTVTESGTAPKGVISVQYSLLDNALADDSDAVESA
jgi:hypothetical protein